MSELKERKGITLVSLVVTIIILLILSAVAINLAVNTDGLFGKAGEASNKWNTAIGQEETDINDILGTMNEHIKDETAMITKWNVAAGETIKLPIRADADYNIEVNWGDGSEMEAYSSEATSTVNLNGNVSVTKLVNSSENAEVMPAAMPALPPSVATHSYTNAGEYEVTITGTFSDMHMYLPENLIEIVQWGENGAMSYDFSDCINLARIALPSKNTFKNVTDISGAFANCTSLTSIPSNLFANCPNVTDFSYTFKNCTSLTSIPSGLFANCPDVTSFDYTFANCTSLTSIPSGLFANCPDVTSFGHTFADCTSLTSIPSDLFANCYNVSTFSFTFYCCSNLTSISSGLFANCPDVTSFDYTFGYCTSLTSIPSNLFANCSNVIDFTQTFNNCRSLTGNAIPLWERVPTPTGTDCYYNCTGLANYADIPDDWK